MLSVSMVRAVAIAACLALLACPAHAFMGGSTLPSSMNLKSPSSFTATSNKLPVTTNMLRKTRAAQTAVTMELVGKRYFLWKVAETAFDKVFWALSMTTVMFAKLLEKIFERTVTNVRLKALKNDLQGIRSTMSTLPAVTTSVAGEKSSKKNKRMNDLDNINTVRELNKMKHNPGEERIHMASQKKDSEKTGSQMTTTNAIDAPTLNMESTFGFLMVSVPFTGILVNLISTDKFVDSLSISAVTAAFLILLVDLAADTPATNFTANIRKNIPRSWKKMLSGAR